MIRIPFDPEDPEGYQGHLHDPSCEECDCEDETSMSGLADECGCDCHGSPEEPDYAQMLEDQDNDAAERWMARAD